MIVTIIGLGILFIIRIRFPRGKSIADIIRKRYDEAYIKKIWRLEKRHFKLRKCHLDLRFLLDCKKNGDIPKFICFKLVNRDLNNSHVYKKSKIRLVEEEIKSKRMRTDTLEKDTHRVNPRMGIFGAAHGWEGVSKSPPFLKSITHVLHWWNWARF